MRHISQKLRDVLDKGDTAAQEVIQDELCEFKAVRVGKYKQEAAEVLKEFQNIADAALVFEDLHLDMEMNKIAKKEMKELTEVIKKDEDKKVHFTAEDPEADIKKNFGFERDVEKKKIEDAKIDIQSQKLVIQKLRNFVKDGCGSSQSSST